MKEKKIQMSQKLTMPSLMTFLSILALILIFVALYAQKKKLLT